MVEKVIRDEKVAVIYSPGYGAGWSTWNTDEDQETLIFSPELVRLIESEVPITDKVLKGLFGDNIYNPGNFRIKWIPVGTAFRINEYDGAESIETYDGERYFTA